MFKTRLNERDKKDEREKEIKGGNCTAGFT